MRSLLLHFSNCNWRKNFVAIKPFLTYISFLVLPFYRNWGYAWNPNRKNKALKFSEFLTKFFKELQSGASDHETNEIKERGYPRKFEITYLKKAIV